MTVAAAALPPLALAAIGVTHPLHVGQAPAYWEHLHIVTLFVFPLLALPPVLVLRDRHPRLAIVAGVLGFVFAAGYTALDVLAGIAVGALTAAGIDSRGVLFPLADAIARPAVWAYLAATVLVVAVLAIGPALRPATARPRLALLAPGGVLVIAGAVSFLTSHIVPVRGVVTMVALGIGWTLLSLPAPGLPRSYTDAARSTAGRDARETG